MARILADSGVPPGEISTAGPALDRWQEILTIAINHGLLHELMTVACADHPAHADELRRLCAAISTFLPGTRSPERVAQLAQDGEAATSEVLDWPSTLPSGQSIDRPERQAIERLIADPEVAVIIVLGEAGTGKSALLATVARTLKASGCQLLGMRLDRMARGVTTDDEFQKYLGLSEAVVDTVAALVAQGPVVVFIDQMDALCDLMTERAGRLALVLNTIERLAALPDTHIVLASRPFEFKHDVRLRRVAATEIELALPPWNDIEPHLIVADVDPKLLSPELREELRRPQTLRTFLQLIGQGHDWRRLPTYHAMREILWQAHIVGTPDATRRQQTLYSLARWMAAEEVLTRPLAQMDEYRKEVEALESAGWLQRVGAAGHAGVTFRHQSLFDFAFARAVVSTGDSLLEQVLEQQGLFIRRRIWSVLAYLREASRDQYLREFARLWTAPKLRRHLRRLLIDFLGQLASPEKREIEWMRGAVADHQWRVQAMIAAGRGTGWFVHLDGRELQLAMADPASAWPCVAVLAGIPASETDRVLALLVQRWMSDANGLVRCASVLTRFPTWTPDCAALAHRLVRRLGFRVHQHLIEELSLAAGQRPTDGVSLFADAVDAVVESELKALRNAPLPAPLPEDADLAERWGWQSRQDKLFDPIRELFEGSIHWTQLSELVKSAPGAFLEALWPIMTRALDTIACPTPGRFPSYLSELRWRSERDRSEYLLIEHLRTAVVAFARERPDDFLVFSQEACGSELMTVHGLVLEGLTTLAEVRPDAFVKYFREDERRMLVGSGLESAGETLRCLVEATKVLDASAQQALAAIFVMWMPATAFPSDWSPERRRRHLNSARRIRLSLLLCLDLEKLTTSTRARIEEEHRAFPDLQRFSLPARDVIGMHATVSRMRVEHMGKASDREILNFLRDLPDETEWRHPRRGMEGGSIEASRELARLTENSPERGLTLARALPPTTHQRPVGMVIEAAAKTEYSTSSLLTYIEECEVRGLKAPEYRVHVAWGLERLAVRKDQPGLPPLMCAILESWLENTPTDDDASAVELPPAGRSSRILYSGHGLSMLPQGNYPALRALFCGLARREPPAWDEWISALETHLQRQEQTRVWQALASRDLRFLVRVDPTRASRFLQSLIERFPDLIATTEGLVLADQFQSRLPPELTQTWFEQVRARGTVWHAQAFGEMLVLRHSRLPDDSWARSQIEAMIVATEPFDEITVAIRRGIGFASALLWHEGSTVAEASAWLCRLASWEDPSITAAIMDLFRYDDAPPFDSQVEALLAIVEAHPVHLRHDNLEGFLDALGGYLTQVPERVAGIAFAVVDAFQQELGDLRLAAARYGGSLLDLALTLQGTPGQLERGLDLFERLQDLNLSEVEEVLEERASQPMTPIPARYRRRRARLSSSR